MCFIILDVMVLFQIQNLATLLVLFFIAVMILTFRLNTSRYINKLGSGSFLWFKKLQKISRQITICFYYFIIILAD